MARSSGPPTAPPAPAAVRSTAPGWRDPRMWVGIAIVAVSVVAGARLLAAADDTVQVWAVAGDMGVGDRVEEADLVAQRVRFADGGALGGYYTVADELPADLQLTRAVGAGELLPRGAVGSAGAAGTVELPVAVDPEQVPPSVAAGSVVDVYLVSPHPTAGGPSTAAPASGPGPGRSGSGSSVSAPAIAEATVVDAPSLEDALGGSGKRQLVLAVPEAEAAAFFAALSGAESPVVTVVRRG